MNHILVPIDFSDDSINALEYAIMVANNQRLNICLIHVKRRTADYNASFNPKDFDEVLKSGIEDSLKRISAQYKSKLHGTFYHKIREGRVFKEICNQAKYSDSEMIIMGTHGVSGTQERWRGSNTFRVVKHASCPVFSIRYNYNEHRVKKIILPIDISRKTRIKVPYAVYLSKAFNATLYLVEVRENNRILTRKTLSRYMANVTQYLDAHNISFNSESLKGKRISDSVIEYALINNADLICVVKEYDNETRNFWLGNKIEQMVNHSPIPILSIPYGNR